MANAFDEFDAPAAASSNPFDEFDPGYTPPNRTGGEVAKDIGIGIVQGGVNLAGGLAELPNIVTGGALDRSVVRPAQRALDRALGGPGEDSGGISGGISRINESLDLSKSPILRQKQQELSDTKGFFASAKKAITDPVLLSQFAAEQVPVIATFGAGSVGAAGKAVSAATRAGLPAKAAAEAGRRSAQRQIIAANTAIGGGFAGQQALQDALSQPDAVWDANPEFAALSVKVGRDEAKQQLAMRAAQIAAGISAPISGAASLIAAPFEAAVFTRGVLPVGAVGAIGREAVEEGVQEGGEQFAQNVGVRAAVDERRGAFEGVPEASGIGAGLGGIMGGGLYAGGRALERPTTIDQLPPATPPGPLTKAVAALPPPGPRPGGSGAIDPAAELERQRSMMQAEEDTAKLYAERADEVRRREVAMASLGLEVGEAKPESVTLKDGRELPDEPSKGRAGAGIEARDIKPDETITLESKRDFVDQPDAEGIEVGEVPAEETQAAPATVYEGRRDLPLMPFTAKGAEREAARRQRNGDVVEIQPHPKAAGRFAVVPIRAVTAGALPAPARVAGAPPEITEDRRAETQQAAPESPVAPGQGAKASQDNVAREAVPEGRAAINPAGQASTKSAADAAPNSARTRTKEVEGYRAKAKELAGNETYFNADLAKETFADYAASNESRLAKSDDVQKAASKLRDEAFNDALSEPAQPGEYVTFMAGGTASGKSSGTPTSGMVYDTTLANFEDARKHIDDVVASGRDARVNYVFTDPVEAFKRMLTRSKNQGRAVPIGVHANTHRGANETMRKLVEYYKDSDRVQFSTFDNTGEKANQLAAPAQFDYNGLDEKLRQTLDAEHAAGNVSDQLYERVAGTGPRLLRQDGAQDAGRSGEAASGDLRRSESTEAPGVLTPPAAPAADIRRTDGTTFPNKMSAGAARAKAGQKDTHDIVQVDGGFALRAKAATTEQPTPEPAPTSAVERARTVYQRVKDADRVRPAYTEAESKAWWDAATPADRAAGLKAKNAPGLAPALAKRAWDALPAEARERIRKRSINRETWAGQLDEQIANPGRFHPVTEAANSKGLRIGDAVLVKGKPAHVTSVQKRGDKEEVQTIGEVGFGGWTDISNVEKAPDSTNTSEATGKAPAGAAESTADPAKQPAENYETETFTSKDGAEFTLRIAPPGSIQNTNNAADNRQWRVSIAAKKGSVVAPLQVRRFVTEQEARAFAAAEKARQTRQEQPDGAEANEPNPAPLPRFNSRDLDDRAGTSGWENIGNTMAPDGTMLDIDAREIEDRGDVFRQVRIYDLSHGDAIATWEQRERSLKDIGEFSVTDSTYRWTSSDRTDEIMDGVDIADGDAVAAVFGADLAKAAAEMRRLRGGTQSARITADKNEPKAPGTQVSANTIFTEDAAAKARELLRKKLGQLSSGIDPQILQAGITLAGYHIEKGARTFAAYAKAMVADLGDAVKPYLKSWYMGVKYDPRASEFDGMSPAAEVESADIDAITEQSGGRAEDEPSVGNVDQAGARAPEGGRKPSAQQPDAEARPGDVAGEQPADVGTAGENEPDGAAGLRPASENVGPEARADEGGNAGDGRAGASGTRDPDAGGRKRPGGSGGGRARRGKSAGTGVKNPEEVSPANTGPGDFVIDDAIKIVGGGQVARFDKNKAAIELRNALLDAGRQPTREEQEVLAGYTGWGSFGQELFHGTWARPAPKEGWQERDRWLRENLGQKEWEGLQNSIINAHYTDPPTVMAMWDMVRRMGFTGGRVLEPSIGIGNFFGLMPPDLASRSQRAGIELDTVAGSMAQLLYPNANIQIKGYEQSKTPDNFYDLVIGNWPFFETGPADRRYARLSPTLHDYFFLKALDQTRPGGLVVGITSKGTMDKVSVATRMEMARKGELVAAFRLPSGAFKEYAGTAVVTDIIILRKRPEPVGMLDKESWINVLDHATKEGTKVKVNEYFHKNPSHVVGEIDYGHGTTSFRPGLIVHRPDDMMAQLKRIAELVPDGAYKANQSSKNISYVANHTSDRTNALVKTDKGFFVVQGEYLAPADELQKYKVKSATETAKREAQLGALIDMRKMYGALIDAERAGDAEPARKALRDAYDGFVKKHGPLNDSFGLSYLERLDDPFYPALAALENQDSKGAYKPAGILNASTMRGAAAIENPTITDAFVLARNGSVNPTLERIAEIAKKPVEEVKKALIEVGAAFEMPNGDFVPSDIYLSGNVREKMRQARAALEEGNKAMQRNIDALEKVIPEDIPYYKIETQLGATWVPAQGYAEYISYMLGMDSTKGIDVSFEAGSWRIKLDDRLNDRPQAKSGFGMDDRKVPFKKLVRAAFANQTITVRKKDDEGTEYTDEKATKEANAKIADMRMKFGEWLWSEPTRRAALESEYNEVRNAYATPHFDGSFLGFQGMALSLGRGPFNLRQHQANAVWRALVTRKSLNAHEVGTGKTFTIGGIAIESRRYGIAKKPMLFAHNANSKSVAHEIQMMYPGARVLYIDNLSKLNLKVRMTQIANDDWDLIVMPHSVIDRIGFKEETLMSMAQEELAELAAAAEEAADEDNVTITPDMWANEDELKKLRSVTAKQLVKQRLKIIQKIQELAQRGSREDSVPFEDMGVDMLLVDEAHEFKKPPIATKMKMKGLQTQTSDRSIALMFLTKYIRSMQNGGNVHLFTGTPITNTMTEVFHMMRYMMQEEMQATSLADWDGWFGSFAREVGDVELTSTGDYEAVTRLQSFINVPELRRMIGQYMDVVFAEDMPEMQPRVVNGKRLADKELSEQDRAAILNGRTVPTTDNPAGATDRPYKKVVNVSADMSPDQLEVFAEVQALAKRWRNMDKKNRKEAMARGAPEVPIIHDGIAEKASFDVRLVNAIDNAGKEGKPEMEPHPDSKPARVLKNLLEIYRSNPDANQVVFMEKGIAKTVTRSEGPVGKKTPKTYPAFSTVRDMIERLVQAGVPREQIALVDGSTSKDKRKEIADAMNSGKIRIVFGSSDSLGVGVNMQRNLRAMHHMDAPWMPGELEQRNGRGHRQGNQWNTVLEYRYLTARLDGRRWQVLAIKQRFITDFMKSKGNVRVIEGDAASDEQSDIMSTFADAAGDPRVLIREKLKKKLDLMQSRERLHTQAVADARRSVERYKSDIASRQQELNRVRGAKIKDKIAAFIDSQRGDGFRMEVGGKTFTSRTDAAAFIRTWLPQELRIGENKKIGMYGDMELFGRWQSFSDVPELYVKIDGSAESSMGPSLNSLDATLRDLRDTIEARYENSITRNQDAMKHAEAVSSEPFHMAESLAKLKQQLVDLERDITLNPVAPPYWLRTGAPVETDVYRDGNKYTVAGHRWTDSGWFVAAADERGDVAIPYMEAKDSQGMPMYEEREFRPPTIVSAGSGVAAPQAKDAGKRMVTEGGLLVRVINGPYMQDGVKLVTAEYPDNTIEEVRWDRLREEPDTPAFMLDDYYAQRQNQANEVQAQGQGAGPKTAAQEAVLRSNRLHNAPVAGVIERLRLGLSAHLGTEVPRGGIVAANPALQISPLIRQLEHLFGKRIQFIRTDEKFNFFSGVVLPNNPNVVYVNAATNKPHMTVAMHEMLHAMRDTNPAIYRALIDALRPQMDLAKYKAEKKLDEKADIEEELTADLLGDSASESRFWMDLSQRIEPSVFRRIAEFVAKFLDRILNMPKRPLHAERYFADYEAARAAVLAATAEYINTRNTRAGEAGGSPAFSIGVNEQIRERVADLFDTKRTFNLWHRTVGTQYHKAQIDSDFRKVYDRGQAYITDLNRMATTAADQAQDILPRLERIADIAKAGAGPRDLKPVAEAMFTGTLVDERVYTDTELRDRFRLNPKQVRLYRQARAAIERSLDDMATTEMVRLVRNDVGAAVADRAARAGSLQGARDALAGALDDRPDLVAMLDGRVEKVAKLKREGYAPLMRFGRYSVTVSNADGSTEYFGLFESEGDARKIEREMVEQYPQATVTRGVMSQEGFRMFRGLSPDTLELFAEAAGIHQSDALQQYMKLAVNSRSALKRLIRRKGIAGYNPDLKRVLAQFVTSNARAASGNLHYGEMMKAVEAIPREKGDVRDEAIKMMGYLQDPQEEATKLRSFLFFNFLGGSIASAAVNMTQPVMMTFPYLSQWGTARAAKELVAAGGKVSRKWIRDPALRAAMDRAMHEGIVEPHQIFELQGAAMQSERDLGAADPIRSAARKGVFVWGRLFSLAEAFNRRLSFAAAFEIGRGLSAAELRAAGVSDAYGFAAKAVNETQGVYNRGNRPDWARGAVGATLFTFKQYSIAYLEFLKRLPTRERALAVGMLMLAAGVNGLPGADDLDDLIDTFAENLGYNFNSKARREQFIAAAISPVFGQFGVDFVNNGVSAALPIDVQARLGLQNLIPATGIGLKSRTDKGREVTEALGPFGGLIENVGAGIQAGFAAAAGGDPLGAIGAAARDAAPLAVQNALKAATMAEFGFYRDSQGRRVIDTDAGDAFFKGIGFQPAGVAQNSRVRRTLERERSLHRVIEDEIADTWAQGIFEKDDDKKQRARQRLQDWNRDNPEAVIRIAPRQIQQRVREMGLTANQRYLKRTPAELRGRFAEELAQ